MNRITQKSFNEILEKQPSDGNEAIIVDHFFGSEITFPSEIRYVTFRNCKFISSNFEGTAFTEVAFEKCVFHAVKFKKIYTKQVEFGNCVIKNSCFKECTLNSISFKFCFAPCSSFVNISARYFSAYCTSFAGSIFNCCNFHDYFFDSSDMTECKVTESTLHLPQFIPSSGSFIGWKKALTTDPTGRQHEVIVKLRIPENAERVCASHKCRASEVEVLGFETLDGEKLPDDTKVFSWWSNSYCYKIGMAKPQYAIDPNPQIECGSGIHFFLDREAAVNYRF